MPEANDHADPPRDGPERPRAGSGRSHGGHGGSERPPAERAAGQPPAVRPGQAPDTSPRASDAERNDAIDRLRTAYVDGRLDQEEFDERSQAALTAKTIRQLERLFDDLPTHYPQGGLAPRRAAPGPVVRPGAGSGGKLLVAVMSGIDRKGPWQVPEEMTAVAFLGGIDLDLRSAILSGPVTTITAVAFMGGIDIIVPPGIRVESGGFGFMGGWENQAGDDRLAPDAPVLRVRGVALMGGVEIRVKEPRAPRGQLPPSGSA